MRLMTPGNVQELFFLRAKAQVPSINGGMMGFRVEVAAKTDVGIVRHNNEDSFGFDARLGIFVLCDGMGGQAAGEVASRLAVDSVLNCFRTAEKSGVFPPAGEPNAALSPAGKAVKSAIQLADRAIREAAAANVSQSGMGSTIVVVLIRGQMITVGHVGDSRAYLLRDNDLRQLTTDHSLVMEQVRQGYITAEEAEHSELQNIIVRALGSGDSSEPDIQDLRAADKNLLLVACDGLTKAVSANEVKAILARAGDLETAAAALIDAAKQNKSDDNITCLLIRLSRRPWYSFRGSG